MKWLNLLFFVVWCLVVFIYFLVYVFGSSVFVVILELVSWFVHSSFWLWCCYILFLILLVVFLFSFALLLWLILR